MTWRFATAWASVTESGTRGGSTATTPGAREQLLDRLPLREVLERDGQEDEQERPAVVEGAAPHPVTVSQARTAVEVRGGLREPLAAPREQRGGRVAAVALRVVPRLGDGEDRADRVRPRGQPAHGERGARAPWCLRM